MEGRGAYTICGLDIGCGWCVEMCDIHNDFDKHCLLSQKRLIKEIYKWFCINFLINDIYDLCISDGITMHSSYSDWTIFPIWFLLVQSIDRVADWFTSTFYKIFSNLYPNMNLESRQFVKHNITKNKQSGFFTVSCEVTKSGIQER